jgi:protein-S-isoprenylcysteine O-methyltransferase Ste14
LAAIQLACIAVIAFTGNIIPTNIASLSLGIGGIILGLWAILVMQLGRFNITPDIHQNSRMVSKGPHKYIRHPMYLSALLVTLAWILDYFTIPRLIIWMVLIFNLIIKLKYEEKLMANRYKEYHDYRMRTKTLIPFIF